MLARLAEPQIRARIAREVDERGLTSFGRVPSWDAVSISTSRTRTRDAGRTIGDLARSAGVAPLDVGAKLLAADEGATYVAVFSIDEADVRTLLRSPAVLVGSDGRAVSRESVAGQGRPHPRFYGTFPRVLGHYARELGLLLLPDAVAKMTGASARALGLRDRGLLREGYRADLDPATIVDCATFEEPHRYPAGLVATIVNGVTVVRYGRHTGALPGRVLRRRAGWPDPSARVPARRPQGSGAWPRPAARNFDRGKDRTDPVRPSRAPMTCRLRDRAPEARFRSRGIRHGTCPSSGTGRPGAMIKLALLFLMTGVALIVAVTLIVGIAWMVVAIPVLVSTAAGYGVMALRRRVRRQRAVEVGAGG